MKRSILFLLLIASVSFYLSAQPYANDWIDYNKTHYKISVTQEGIHRIPSSVLSTHDLTLINPDRFILYRNGEEIPIYIHEQGATIEYIEFYAYPNDGQADQELYRDPDWQPHTHYSLFSDEATYYLTWNDAGVNARLVNTSNDLTNLPPKESYFWYTSRNVYTSGFSRGEPLYVVGTPLYNSLFAKGEGFIGGNQELFYNSVPTRNFALQTPSLYNNASLSATLKAVVIGSTINQHHYQIRIGPTTIEETTFDDFELVRHDIEVPLNLILPTTNVVFQAIPTSVGTNRNTMAMIEMEYPRLFDFENQSFFSFQLEGSGTRKYLEITNVDAASSQPILYDLTNGYRIEATDPIGSTTWRYALPASSLDRHLVLQANNLSELIVVNTLTPLNFKDYTSLSNQGNYILLTHSSLLSTPELADYAQYRSMDYTVQIVDIDELYEQFGYGIQKSPLAIRNFIEYISEEWTISPEYVFIIGKAREYDDMRFSNFAYNQCLVPTLGDPGSDILLASDKLSSVPNIPIGRLAAETPEIIDVYLRKVSDYEAEQKRVGDPYQTLEEKLWMKELIHFGGGATSAEQNTFKSYLNSYKSKAENVKWGANVYSVFKTSSDPIQVVQSEVIRERINNGVSLITFFGHSYAGGFDLSFDEPENYQNAGKYPIFLANGCNSGLIHGPSPSISEEFVFVEDKGAVAYLSTTDLSASNSLHVYSNRFYENLSGSDYLKGIGDIVKRTVQEIENCCSGPGSHMMVAQEMTLHGDPAISFNHYDETDLVIEPQHVSFSPSYISVSTDSFDINIEVYNLGKAVNDSANIELTRIYPDGTQEIFVKRFKAPLYKDVVSFTLPVIGTSNSIGLNSFNLYVDVDDEIPGELSETNNYLLNEVSTFITSDNIFPVYPYEFAVVPNQNVTLKASTGDPFVEDRNYVFQIDTSELFAAPLAEGEVYQGGGVVKWSPQIVLEDSTVYYWRVSKDDVYDGQFQWEYSSFIYLNNEFPGWNQSHYYQWLKDDYQNIYVDTDREFKYIDDTKDVFVRTGNYFVSGIHYEEMEFKINGAQFHNWQMNNCGGGVGFPAGLSIAVFDHLTGLPREVINASTTSSYGPYGNIHCVGSLDTRYVANFKTTGITPAGHPTPGVPWADLITDYLEDVPLDDYVIIYSINDPDYASWDVSLMNYMQSKGSSVTSSTQGPMILVYENATSTQLMANIIGSSMADIISTNIIIQGQWNAGNVKSPLIGPAVEWGSFHWKTHSNDQNNGDDYFIEIYGSNGSDSEIFLTSVAPDVLDTTLHFIDANLYPFIFLRLVSSDAINRTPIQMDYWRVLYQKVPEAAINPNRYFSMSNDSLQQGETLTVQVAVENISDYSMDSLWTKYRLQSGNGMLSTDYVQYDSLSAWDTIILSYTKETIEQSSIGVNSLMIEANPIDFNHQLEQYHFNNIAILPYYVFADEENPLLDVTFDGVRIFDGDLVSAKPEIVVHLKDENVFLALDDTSLIDVYFRYIEDGTMWRASFSNPDVQFYPASQNQLNEKNEAIVELRPEFINDGTYELIVRTKDRSGNTSSTTENRVIDQISYDYKISFEVMNKPSISNVLNYPNPFTTQTKFVFTLTGSEIPTDLFIDIMTVKGTIIKQIDLSELGPIHIGRNITEYAWDGRDEYGDLVANGVYFYRVRSSLNGQDMDHFSIDQVDDFFRKGIGKMVFIR